MIQARKAPIQLKASTDRRQVLQGAEVVITTIGVGGRRAWEQDVFIPRKYGISMPVGDTAGPGGTSRALRMIPAMVDIARDVLELAPEACFSITPTPCRRFAMPSITPPARLSWACASAPGIRPYTWRRTWGSKRRICP